MARPAPPPRILGLLLLTLWCGACTLGFLHANAYSATPGQSRPAPSIFPSDGGVALAPEQSTLILFLHPRCSCSLATLDQLEVLLARLGENRPRVGVLMFIPGGAGQDWTESKLWERARALADVVETDEGGWKGRRFGAYTSGACALYGADGKLLYSGGVTDSRGHAGASEGGSAIVAILSGQPSEKRFASTFGCQISEEDKRDSICR